MARKRKEETALGRYINEHLARAPKVRTLPELAAASDISVNTLNSWIRGSIADPGVNNLRRVADALGAPFEDLCRAAAALETIEAKFSAKRLAQREWLIGTVDVMSQEEMDDLVNQMQNKLDPHQKRLGIPDIRVSRERTAAS